MTDVERLTAMVSGAMADIEHCDLSTDGIAEAYQPLADTLRTCLLQVREVYVFTASIADGAFEAPIPARHNYFVGPSKDLYYKLKHLTWQAEEVAKGDYSQRVDFLGSFSDSFNFMITELERREKHEAELAEEKLQAARKQNMLLKRQMERQMFHYRAYRNFIYSFMNFRIKYKQMMGEVYALFNEGRYEEGRLLVAEINDRMATEVIVGKDYSNNDFINAAMADISEICQKRGVAFEGRVHIPECLSGDGSILLPERVFHLSELVFSLLEIPGQRKKSLEISGGERKGWFSLRVTYRAGEGVFPPAPEACLPAESQEILEWLKTDLDSRGSIIHVEYDPDQRKIEISIHICTGK